MTAIEARTQAVLWQRLRTLAGIVVLATVYAEVAKLSLAAAAVHHVVSSIWPPSGIALFALLQFGLRLWPGIAIGAFVLNWTNGISPAGSALIAVGNTMEAVAGVYLLTRVVLMHRALDRVRDIVALAGIGALFTPMIAATIGVASLILTGGAESSAAVHLWSVWWTGDAIGVLAATPFLLTWSSPDDDHPPRRYESPEIVITFVLFTVAISLLFQSKAGLLYCLFPLSTWIALRLGRRGAATAVAVVMGVATWRTVTGTGPFAVFSPLGNLFALQLLLAVLAVATMLFAAARAEAFKSAQELRKSEARYRILARNLPDGVVTLYDRDLRLLIVEGPALVTAGFTKEAVEGQRLTDIFDAAHANALKDPFLHAFAGRTHEFEFAYAGRSFLVRVLPISDSAGSITMGMALALDITARHAAEREIAESHARLEVLSRRLLQAQEEERRRVAREVHDELGQALTAIKLGVGSMRSRPQRRNSVETDRRILNVSTLLDGAIESVQRIVLRLRPGVLDSLGPLAALEWEVQQFTTAVPASRSGSTFRNIPSRSTANNRQPLYRTVQEALTTVVRHAEAKSVIVGLEAEEDALVLQVTDDGCGIPDQELRNPRSPRVTGDAGNVR